MNLGLVLIMIFKGISSLSFERNLFYFLFDLWA